MEILNWNKLVVMLFLFIFYGCGQQTMKDEGLETKSINEAASSTPTFSIESLDISPSNPSATADNITFTIDNYSRVSSRCGFFTRMAEHLSPPPRILSSAVVDASSSEWKDTV